ncbi:MAG: MOSC domain-containing protein [Planctomycetota bacterium]
MNENESSAEVVAVCIGDGGIPKHPIETVRVGPLGLEGDGHNYRGHGGENRAVCLLSVEAYESLREDDVDCEAPGTFGENVLTRGLDDSALGPGDRLRLGDEVVVEIHDVRAPCKTLATVDARFPDLMIGRSGWVCRVIEPGTLRAGATIERVS